MSSPDARPPAPDRPALRRGDAPDGPRSMDGRQSRALLVLAAVLVGLVALITLTEAPDSTEPDAPGERAWTPAEPLTAAEVEAVRVERPGQPAVDARRDADGWRLGPPADGPADPRRVEELIDAVRRLELGDPLPGDAADYGLGDAAAVITLQLSGGRSRVVRVGDDAPVGSSTYLQVDAGAPRPSRTRLGAALPGAEGWRDAALTGLRQAELSAIELRSPIAGALVQRSGAWWLVRGDREDRADSRAVDALLDALWFARVEGFGAPAPAEGAPWALDLSLVAGDRREDLRFTPGDSTWTGQAAHQGGGWFTLRPGELGAAAPAAPEALLDRRLLPVRAVTVDRVEVQLGEHQLDARRTEDGWSDPRADAILTALQEAGADRVRSPPAERVADPVWGRVRLHEGESRVEELELRGIGDDGARVGVEPSGGAPFWVDGAALRALAAALAHPPVAASAP